MEQLDLDDTDLRLLDLLQRDASRCNNALAELANVIAATGANIHAISTEEKDGRVYLVTLLITTKGRIHLANIMRKIRVMPNVLKVSRQKN